MPTSELTSDERPPRQGAESKRAAADERDYAVRAVERVCSILNLLQESADGASLLQVAYETKLPKSSAFRYLRTLEAHRYVERNPETGAYHLGVGFIGMQSHRLELLSQRARPWMEQLRDEFGETINLAILDGDRVRYLEIVESRRGVRLAPRPGDRAYIHATAVGKAIAAYLLEGQVRDILTVSGMPQLTPNTITDAEDYLADLAKVHRRGYATDNGEDEVDGRCVAVPILGNTLPSALSLSAPTGRFPLQDVERVAAALTEAAAQLATPPGAKRLA